MALAPGRSSRCLLQALVSVVGHAQFSAFVVRKPELDRLSWFAVWAEYEENVTLTRFQSLDLETLSIGPRCRWPLINFDPQPLRIDLPIWKSRGLFPKRIVNPRGHADAASGWLRASGMGNRQNECDYNETHLHDSP